MSTPNMLAAEVEEKIATMQAYMDNKDSTIKGLCTHIREFEAEIATLKEGVCRFHCRTAKDNWIAGYLYCVSLAGSPGPEYAERNYNEWKRQQETSAKSD